MEEWARDIRAGRFEKAWDLFVSQYRRLLFAAIRHYVKDHDEVMDAFANVCEGLREGNMRRLRNYLDAPSHRASFTTWLVTVVRNLTVDWLRQRHGRTRPADLPEDWSPLRRRIFELVFVIACPFSTLKLSRIEYPGRQAVMRYPDFKFNRRITVW